MSRPKGFAVASGGGHLQQMMLLSRAFDGCDMIFITTNADFVDQTKFPTFRVVSDTNRNDVMGALRCLRQCISIVRQERPDFIVSTGALPGLICIAVGRWSGAKTVWVDSLANAERPSMCGRVARRFVSAWFTQWEHLARPASHEFQGALL
jgi:UDP-N-acetylglucosamine:LPS N-acetylglucosamine transferase